MATQQKVTVKCCGKEFVGEAVDAEDAFKKFLSAHHPDELPAIFSVKFEGTRTVYLSTEMILQKWGVLGEVKSAKS